MQHLNIAVVQYDIYWENVQKNLDYLQKKLHNLPKKTDIVVLPEMFTTGFTMNVSGLAESNAGKTVQWLKRVASEIDTVVTGSIIIAENQKYYNRLFWVTADGDIHYYDKRHLFRMADEHLSYTSGMKPLIVEHKGWKISPLICYDLRFPVWSRNRNNGYDLQIYVANWPERRSDHWKTLLKARAIENQCYIVGVNRIGMDANKIRYSGDSLIYNPLGKELCNCGNSETIEMATLDYDTLNNYRTKFPVWQDADIFRLDT